MKGIRLKTWFVFSLLFVAMASMGAESLFAATDVTDKVQINKSRMRFDRRTSENYLDVSLTNISQDIVLSPIKVVIDSISADTVSIANADGYTEDGKPYFEYSTANDLLEASETTSSKSWRFSNPRRARFNFAASVWGVVPEAAALIGPEGGVVEVTDPLSPLYKVKVHIPEGCISENTVFSVSKFSGLLPPNQYTNLSRPIKLSSNKPFTGFVAVTVPLLHPINGDDGIVIASHYDEINNIWDTKPIVGFNENHDEAVVLMDHFSGIIIQYLLHIYNVPESYTTGFNVSRDSFNENLRNPDACFGMSNYALWHFFNKEDGLRCWWNVENSREVALRSQEILTEDWNTWWYGIRYGFVELALETIPLKGMATRDSILYQLGVKNVPTVLGMMPLLGAAESHAIVVTGYERIDDNTIEFSGYDPNYPLKTSKFYSIKTLIDWEINHPDYPKYVFFTANMYHGEKYYDDFSSLWNSHPGDNWCDVLDGLAQPDLSLPPNPSVLDASDENIFSWADNSNPAGTLYCLTIRNRGADPESPDDDFDVYDTCDGTGTIVDWFESKEYSLPADSLTPGTEYTWTVFAINEAGDFSDAPAWWNFSTEPIAPACTDSDGDGYYLEEGCDTEIDCDDTPGTGASIYPGAQEVCDGKINNCNNLTAVDGSGETWFNQDYNCGTGGCVALGSWTCQNGVQVGTCTPGSPTTEVCGDGIDQDCDGFDPACPVVPVPGHFTAEYQSEHGWNHLTWDPVPGANEYRIYWGTGPEVSTGSNQLSQPVTSPYGHSGVLPGGVYYYKIMAVVDGVASELSDAVAATVPGNIPQNVQVVYQPDYSWNYITWNEVPNATEYHVYWSTETGVTTASGELEPTITTEYGHTGVLADRRYCYRTASVVEGVESTLSKEVCDVVPDDGGPKNYELVQVPSPDNAVCRIADMNNRNQVLLLCIDRSTFLRSLYLWDRNNGLSLVEHLDSANPVSQDNPEGGLFSINGYGNFFLNDKGEVAGGPDTRYRFSQDAFQSFFFWDKDSGIEDILPDNPGHFPMRIDGLNNTGLVIGSTENENYGHSDSFFWNRTNGYDSLNYLGDEVHIFSVNDHDQVVGTELKNYLTGYYSYNTGYKEWFLWDTVNGKRTISPDNSDYLFRPQVINNNGVVAGTVFDVNNYDRMHGFVWHNGTCKYFGDANYFMSVSAINNSNQVAGYASYNKNGMSYHHPIFWDKNTGIIVPPTPSPGTEGIPGDIMAALELNDFGEVLCQGYWKASHLDSFLAYVWKPLQSDLVSLVGGESLLASGMNDIGGIYISFHNDYNALKDPLGETYRNNNFILFPVADNVNIPPHLIVNNSSVGDKLTFQGFGLTPNSTAQLHCRYDTGGTLVEIPVQVSSMGTFTYQIEVKDVNLDDSMSEVYGIGTHTAWIVDGSTEMESDIEQYQVDENICTGVNLNVGGLELRHGVEIKQHKNYGKTMISAQCMARKPMSMEIGPDYRYPGEQSYDNLFFSNLMSMFIGPLDDDCTNNQHIAIRMSEGREGHFSCSVNHENNNFPVITLPDDNAMISTPPFFQWNTEGEVSRYKIVVSYADESYSSEDKYHNVVWSQEINADVTSAHYNSDGQAASLEEGKAYFFDLYAYDMNGAAAVTRHRFRVAQRTPQIISVNCYEDTMMNSSDIYLHWTDVGAEHYLVYWGTDDSVSEQNHQVLDPTTTTHYLHTAVEPRVTYWYRVKAIFPDGTESRLSDIKSCFVPSGAVHSPVITTIQYVTNFQGTGDSGIYLRWTDVGAEQYLVYWGTDDSVSEQYHQLLEPTSTTDYLHSGVDAGSTYWYRVKAIFSSGWESELSDIKGYPPTPIITFAQYETNFQGTGDSGIYLRWTDVGAEQYFVYWGTDDSVSEQYHQLLEPTSTTDYLHSGVDAGSTYWYRVKAIFSSGWESELSEIVDVPVE